MKSQGSVSIYVTKPTSPNDIAWKGVSNLYPAGFIRDKRFSCSLSNEFTSHSKRTGEVARDAGDGKGLSSTG
jgi:hypothetical protein